MKLRKLSITNVTSYRDPTHFDFGDSINILIGPNGGGKSNLQRILWIVLSHFFIPQYDFVYSDKEARVSEVEPLNARALQRALPPFFNDPGPQEIYLELSPEEIDLDNIRTIQEHLPQLKEQLAYYEYPLPEYEPFKYLDLIAASKSLPYTIRDLKLARPSDETAESAFLKYLRTFYIFLRASQSLTGIRLSLPVFYFSAERTFSKTTTIPAAQFTETDYFNRFKNILKPTAERTELFQLGLQYFAKICWLSLIEAGGSTAPNTTIDSIFFNQPEVQLLQRYLERLGYHLTFRLDPNSVAFTFELEKDTRTLRSDMLSSGEREVAHFLVALCALSVRQGLVIIDEPELHLHPQWQRMLLILFREVATEQSNQFIISTHSPVFVTPDTIDDITRIYKPPDKGSTHVSLSGVPLPDKQSLVRMINTQNNERLFFADRVVLVEGITDRIVLSTLLTVVAQKFARTESIEVLEVGGKGAFDEYEFLLEKLDTPVYTVADLDYLREKGSGATRALFAQDYQKQWDALTGDKKSRDAQELIYQLDAAITTGDAGDLRKFWEYLSVRHWRLKSPLHQPDQAKIDADITRLRKSNVFILRHGEIEDYLPDRPATLKQIIRVTTDPLWINSLDNVDRRIELGEIVTHIADLKPNERELLRDELSRGALTLAPISRERIPEKRSG